MFGERGVLGTQFTDAGLRGVREYVQCIIYE